MKSESKCLSRTNGHIDVVALERERKGYSERVCELVSIEMKIEKCRNLAKVLAQRIHGTTGEELLRLVEFLQKFHSDIEALKRVNGAKVDELQWRATEASRPLEKHTP